MSKRRNRARRAAQRKKVQKRFKARVARGRSGLTGGQKGTGAAGKRGSTISLYRAKQKEQRETAARARQEAFKQEREAKAAQAARKKNLDRKLKNFDAKAYLSRYKDLSTAFGTDEAAARRHYIKHGFDENRDISKPVSTTAPSGAFGISAAGKLQAEANK